MIFLHSFLDDIRYILIANKNPANKIRCIADHNVFHGGSSLNWKAVLSAKSIYKNTSLYAFLFSCNVNGQSYMNALGYALQRMVSYFGNAAPTIC